MASNPKVGIIYDDNPQWIAGKYYIHNLIFALKNLSNYHQPSIYVFTDSIEKYNELKNITGYEKLYYRPYKGKNIWEKAINTFSSRLFSKLWLKPQPKEIDAIFPLQEVNSYYFDKLKKIYWIPDFQHYHYPEYFNDKEINRRNKQFEQTAKEKHIVVSSLDSLNDFRKFHPHSKAQLHVLNFAVTHPDYSLLNIDDLKQKFNIKGEYFICSNQFWPHKNQILVLRALKLLKNKGIEKTVVFTGKTDHPSSKQCYSDFCKYAEMNKLTDNIRVLGLIDRKEQLCLMQYSQAVIQPSLFEGWNTGVEDAKAMGKTVLLSDIAVHREQVSNTKAFFDCHKENELAYNMEDTSLITQQDTHYDYNIFRKQFATTFIKLIRSNE